MSRKKPVKKAKKNSRQNLLWIVISTALIILMGAVIWSPWNTPVAETVVDAPTPAPATATLPRKIPVEQAYLMVADSAFLLDVRTQEEWDEYHVPAAVHIPLDVLAIRVDELPQDQDIVVICHSGNRSVAVRDWLFSAGFMNVTSSDGGMIAWNAAGYPTEDSTQ